VRALGVALLLAVVVVHDATAAAKPSGAPVAVSAAFVA
jgi:hypothetical protein